MDFLKSKNLTDNLMHYVLYAIAMATEDTPCIEGMSRTQKFLLSLGRYGNTPFLWPMYGSGEIPQAFCRYMSAFYLPHVVVDKLIALWFKLQHIII